MPSHSIFNAHPILSQPFAWLSLQYCFANSNAITIHLYQHEKKQSSGLFKQLIEDACLNGFFNALSDSQSAGVLEQPVQDADTNSEFHAVSDSKCADLLKHFLKDTCLNPQFNAVSNSEQTSFSLHAAEESLKDPNSYRLYHSHHANSNRVHYGDTDYLSILCLLGRYLHWCCAFVC